MIGLRRGPEPGTLAAARTAELVRVGAIAPSHAPTAREIGTRYRYVVDQVWTQQHRKCAYCEAPEQRRRNDVEHFRPKGRIDPMDGSPPV